MLRGLSIKAVLLGVVADWAMSFVVGILVVIYVLIFLQGTTPARPDMQRVNTLLQSGPACAFACIVGGLLTLIPGFFTGWLAKSDRVKNALVMGVVSAASSFVFLPFAHGYPFWYFPGCAITTIGFATVGGFLANLAFGTRSPDAPSPAQPIR